MGIFSGFIKSSTVYFPGCITYYKFRENFELYKRIFSKLGISYRELDKKLSSGLPALEAGYEKEARKIARRNLEIFREQGINSILTTSPQDYKMFKEDYAQFLPDWNLSVINTWELILSKLQSRSSRLIKNEVNQRVTYHDSCYLSRYCDIIDEPRQILELIGYELVEMNDSKKDSLCCGSCGGLAISNPDLAEKIAKERVLQAKRIGVNKIIVASMENYALMKKVAVELGIEVLELSMVLAHALGIKTPPLEIQEEEIIGEEKILQETQINEVNEEKEVSEIINPAPENKFLEVVDDNIEIIEKDE